MERKSVLDMSLCIVGGGPAGLATAIALRRKGFQNLVVYERDSGADARAQGYSFSLFYPSGGLGYLEQLGLGAEFEKISFEGKGFRIADSVTGEAYLIFPPSLMGNNTRSRRVMRAGLRNMLVEICKREGVNIVWNARIRECVQMPNSSKVSVSFENQDTAEFDLLIGADGAHSVVRKSLIGDELNYTGYTSFMGITTRDKCPEVFDESGWFNKAGGIGCGRGVTFFGFHHPPDEIFWGVTVQAAKGEFDRLGGDKAKLREVLLRKVESMTPYLKSVIEKGEFLHLLEYNDRTPLKLTSAKRITERRDSRITLMGDAAHLMVPFRAMGGNNALIDSNVLVDRLSSLVEVGDFSEQELLRVLSDYETEMINRTSKEVLGSRNSMISLHSSSPITIFFRNTAFSFLNWKVNVYSQSVWRQIVAKAIALGVVAVVGDLVYQRVTGKALSSMLN